MSTNHVDDELDVTGLVSRQQSRRDQSVIDLRDDLRDRAERRAAVLEDLSVVASSAPDPDVLDLTDVELPRASSSVEDALDRAAHAAPSPSPVTTRAADPRRLSGLRRLLSGRYSGLATTPTVLLMADVVAWAVTAPLASGGALAEALLLVTLVAVQFGTGGYRARLTLSGLDQLPRITLAAGAGMMAHLTYSLLTAPEAGVGTVVLRGVLLWSALVLTRSAAVAVIKAARRAGLVEHRTLVIGAGDVGRELTSRLLERRELGLRPVGVLDRQPLHEVDDLPVPWMGDVDQLARVVTQQSVDVVVVAFSRISEGELVDVLRMCDRLEVEFFFVPRLFEVQSVHGEMDEAWGMPLLRVRRAAYRTRAWQLKRMIDVVVSAVALLVAAPVMAGVALAVRSEGGRGVLFRQQRIGLDGRPFTIMKFRSMRPVDETESQTQWNVSQDSRVGPVGKIIRATSLDELPQLFNVLRGDMSLVGPRPERPHFVEEFADRIPRYTGRHRVPAGLTGLAAVSGLRGDTSIEDRARIDNYYIENWSLWLDVKVVLRTLVAVLRRTGS